MDYDPVKKIDQKTIVDEVGVEVTFEALNYAGTQDQVLTVRHLKLLNHFMPMIS